MTPENKQMALARINSLELDALKNYIQRGEISLDEMIRNGLNGTKKAQLEEYFSNLQRDRQMREQQELRERQRVEQRSRHLEAIKTKDPGYTEERIQSLMRDGLLTPNDLMVELGWTEQDIARIWQVEDRDTGFDDWKELPPLPGNRTDIYVFGIVGSGKSSMLAGILYQAQMRGILEADVDYPVGVQYKDDLVTRVKMGILPKSTRSDVLNFISINLYDNNENPHPVNIIEMSGEKFSNTYRRGVDESSIGARQYLKSANRKILMFAVDYHHYITGADRSEDATQAAKLEMALQLLEKDGTLAKTDALFFVVTKADLMDENDNIGAATQRFIESSEYKNFLRLCKRLKGKFGFELAIFPFSLGRFILPKTYYFEPKYSDQMLDLIIMKSFRPVKTCTDIFNLRKKK